MALRSSVMKTLTNQGAKRTRHLMAAMGVVSLLASCPAVHGAVHIPLFVNGSNPMQQSFVRLVNLEEDPKELLVTAIDDGGMQFGPVSFVIEGHAVQHFNSDALQERLSSEVGETDRTGDWRLIVESAGADREFDARGFARTQDGFVTSLQDTADNKCDGIDCYAYVPTFNPAENPNQQSRLRLVNRSDSNPVEVTIVGVDDAGISPGSEVRLTLEAGSSRTITAADLESGGEGLEGSLGDGQGKWRLSLNGEGGWLQVLSLLESPTGHLTNLSSRGYYWWDVSLFRPAGHPTQQSFVRLVNLGEVTVTVKMTAFDDAGIELGTASLDVPANGASHFNSNHLAEWLDLPGDTGDLRLVIDRDGYFNDIEVYAYIRTKDGFLTSMHDIGRPLEWPDGNHDYDGNAYRYVQFFNPGGNTAQRSQLRIVNWGYSDAAVTVVSVDDRGASRGRGVSLRIPEKQSRTVTSADLESGGIDFDGSLGDGVGKWRLFVFSDDMTFIHVMSLLESPTGHLTNLTGGVHPLTPELPPVIRDRNLRALVAEALGKPADASVSRKELDDLTSLTIPAGSVGSDVRDAIQDWTGLQLAVNLTRLEIAGTGQFDLSALADLVQLEHLDLGGHEVADLTPLSGLTDLQTLDLSYTAVTDITPLAGLTDLQTLDLSYTAVTDITPLAGLTRLRTLNLSSNSIADVSPLAELHGLTTLDLARNQIRDISALAELTALQDLDLWDNDISNISPLAGLTTLQDLDLRHNDISDISPLAGLTTLQMLDLEHNDISNISPLAGLTTLQDLDLRHNDISDISPLAGLTTLQMLDLGHNDISDISPLAGLTTLQGLGLSVNDISDISPLAGLTTLQGLGLSDNDISDISPLVGLTALRTLLLTGNNISDISALAGMDGLWWLEIQNNAVVDISALQNLTGLYWLDLSLNAVVDISALQNLTGLWWLDLSHNAVEDVSALEGLTNLGRLDLGFNAIEDLTPLAANTGFGDHDRIDLRGNSALTDESINVVIAELKMRGARVDVPVLRWIQFEAVHNDDVAVFRVNANIGKAHPHPDVGTDLLLEELTSEFYKYFEDDFDFMVIVANVETDGGLAIYESVSNDLEGIGRIGRYYASTYGSRRLQGVLYFPWNTGPLQTGPTLHEFMHRWGNKGFIPTTGHPPAPKRAAGVIGSHWGFSSVNGVLGGFNIDDLQDLGDGRYAVPIVAAAGRTGNRQAYSPLELYLSGFVAPEEVPDVWVAADGWFVLNGNNISTTEDGNELFTAGDVRTYTIDDLVALHGPRVPALGEAQWHFRTAVVLLTDDEHPAMTERLDALSEEAAWFTLQSSDDDDERYNFFEATRGLGSMTMDGLSASQKAVPAAPVGLPASFGEVPAPYMMMPDGTCVKVEQLPVRGSAPTGGRLGGGLDEEHLLREWTR